MTLDELKQIKDSLDKGVMIHRKRWLEVLEWAITVTEHYEDKDWKNASHD